MNSAAQSPQSDLMHLLSELSELLLSWSWEGVVGYEQTVESVGRAFGAEKTSVYMTAQSAAIQVGDEVAFVKIGIPGIPQLRNVQLLRELVNDICAGKHSIEDARARVAGLANSKNLYSGFLRWLGVVIIAMAFAVDVVGTWEGVLWAGVAGLLSGLVFLAQDTLAGFDRIAQLVATFASGLVVMIAAKAGITAASPGLLLISATFVFIPGDSISTQAYEIAQGRWSAGVDRFFYAVMMLVLMVTGAILAAEVTDTPLELLLPVGPREGFAWWAVYPARAVFVLGILLAFQMRWAHLVPAVISLWIVTAVAQYVTLWLGPFAATFMAMLVGTLIAGFLAKSGPKVESYILLIPMIFALSPGSHGLRQLEIWASQAPTGGLRDLGTLAGTLVAIAIGLLLGKIVLEEAEKPKTPRR